MHNSPFFSIVIPAYKLQFLSETMESLMAQTFQDFELIVVNDKSPGNIKALIERYQDSRIIYYENQENLGKNDLVASWNHACGYAQGKYLLVASDDDFYSSDFLEKAHELALIHPECELIRGRVRKIFDEGTIHEEEGAFDMYMQEPRFVYYLIRHGFKCSANYIYKRVPFMEKGGFVNFPCASYTDVATPLMMASKGVLNINDSFFYFRVSNIQISSDFNKEVLKKKVLAISQFAVWAQDYMNSLEEDGFIYTAKYILREDIVLQIQANMKHLPFRCFSEWKKFVFSNRFLNKQEKLSIFVKRLAVCLR